MLYVLGHKNPDTDSVTSALAYAEFLEQKGKEAQAIALGKLNKETEFILNKFKVDSPEVKINLPTGSQIVLMDHNEISQSIDNRDELELVEIIDHHKINLKTEKPVSICIKPLGSSCSIVAEKFWQENLTLSQSVASLLIAGIISDTLYFRSPTTTNRDKEIVKKLNQIAQIENLEEFSLAMFQAKSDLGDISVTELVKLDYKEFNFKGHKIAIGVMETTDKNFALNRKEDIEKELERIKREENLEVVFFVIVDILKEESWTITSGKEEKQLFQEVFSAKEKEGVLYKNKLVSRKKQIVPLLEEYFKSS